MRDRPRRNRWGILLIGAGFVVALWLPVAESLLGFDPAPRPVENRLPAPAPRLAWEREALAAVPRAFEAWFNDHLGLRNTLVRGHNRIKAQWLGVSPSPLVTIGGGGWLYVSRTLFDPPAAPPAEQGAYPWEREIAERGRWLAHRGIRYLVVVTSDKGSIYPERLPAGKRPARPDPRRDGLIRRLEAQPELEVIDLRPLMLAAKARFRAYHRTDMHWTDRAAFLAYGEIAGRLRRWFPAIAPLPREAFAERREERWSGPLARILGLEDLFREEVTWLVSREPQLARPAPPPARRRRGLFAPVARGRPGSGLPRAVMLHDSFSRNLVPWLSEHFSRIVFLWQQELERELVERERPDVVIQQINEFRLIGPLDFEPLVPAP